MASSGLGVRPAHFIDASAAYVALYLVPNKLFVCISKDANIFQCAAAAVSGVRTAVSNVQTGVTEVKTGVTELTTYVRSNVSTGKL